VAPSSRASSSCATPPDAPRFSSLGIERRHGLRIGSPIGGKHANYHMPLVAHGAGLPSPAKLRALLREVGRALRLDAFVFANLPLSWHGIANPLAERGRPSPSNSYRLTLSADAETTLTRALSKDARKKLRQKDKKLRERAPVAHLVARTAEEADAILAAFLAQKRERFREMGLPIRSRTTPRKLSCVLPLSQASRKAGPRSSCTR
jgi:CelD/BcsL family acetyltransferase involved in cellulose biosynthesis